MKPWYRIAFVGIGIAAMLLVGVIHFWLDRQAEAAQKWPVTEARVVDTDLVREVTTNSNSRSSGGQSRTSVTWRPVVVYDYVVAGRRYRSDRLWLSGTVSYDQRTATSLLSQYRIGMPLSVHYDPNDPAAAAISVEGPSAWFFLFYLIGLPFIIVGWLLRRPAMPVGKQIPT